MKMAACRSFFPLRNCWLFTRRIGNFGDSKAPSLARGRHDFAELKCPRILSASCPKHLLRSSAAAGSQLAGSQKLKLNRNLHGSIVLYDDVRVITSPPFAESVSEGDIRWEKGVGDFVKEDEVVGEIETDKTAIPLNAPASGVIQSLLVEDGDKVVAGQELYKLQVTDSAPPPSAASDKPVEEAASPPPPAPAAPSPVTQEIPTTPPPVPPKPTEPMSSIPVSQVKVTPAVEISPSPLPSPPPATPPPAAPAQPAGPRAETRVKMTRIRMRTAVRLKEAQNTAAMLTTFNELDMGNIIEMRKQYQDSFTKKYGIKLGFMSAFVKATAFALQDQPVVNSAIDEDHIVYRDYVDIGIAVATPKGLVVPMLRDVQNMNYANIELGIHELGEKARLGRLAVEDMMGGTFTISNGGVFGSLFGTPIINPPQSAILGMHATKERPVVVNGKVEIRPMMYVALTYDHRLIDGREAVTFLKKIKSAVEDPRILLLDV